MRPGSARMRFHASQQTSMMWSSESKRRCDRMLSRMNCQSFSMALHAAARVVHSEMPQGEVADVPDAVLDNSIAFEIGAGFDELTQFLLQLRRQQGRPARALPIPQTIDALGIVAHNPITQYLPIHAGLTGRLLPVS